MIYRKVTWKRVLAIAATIFLVFSIGACTREEKWLVYERANGPPFLYRGHVIYTDSKQKVAEQVQDIVKDAAKPVGEAEKIRLGKPVVDEDDEARVLLLSPPVGNLICEKTEKPFGRPPERVETRMGIAPSPATWVCDLQVRDKGGTQIDFKIKQPGTPEVLLTDDSVQVHALYRFRVMAGPVYSTLTRRRKTFGLKNRPSGQQFVDSDSDSNAPVDFPVFLKVFWDPKGRDLLQDLPLLDFRRLNPVVGINASDSPLNNFYTGVSVETWRGVDIVGGAHWSKVKELTAGFTEGQETSVQPATRSRFAPGWFLGATVDVGVAADWIGKSIAGLLK